MFAIEVEFLMGRAVATEWQERTTAEWPPHPQRLFSALVAAHFDLQGGSDSEAALKWLESLPPPEIRAVVDPTRRAVLSHWVPVNDDAIKVEKAKVDQRHPLERRNRQERWFPAVVPEDPVVVFQWLHAPDTERHVGPLRAIVENLSYLGHSSSPVRACVRTNPVAPTLYPAQTGDLVLRVPGPGRFERLRQVHELRLEDESVQPPLGRTQPYTTVPDAVGSVFEREAIVLAFEHGPRLALDSTLPLLQHLRTAVLARLGDSAPEVLTGHRSDGSVSAEPHLAFLPLGHVRGRFADGSLKGAALVLPRTADDLSRTRLRRSLAGRWELTLGPLGTLSVRMLDHAQSDLIALRFPRYAAASKQWASVTPVILDRHPKAKGPSAEDIVAECCRRIGLPAPAEVRVGAVSAFSSAPRAYDFHGRAAQIDGRARRHVLLRFDKPVHGPVMLGAGRFLGLGICLPFAEAQTL
jgi:CRISPR-associated protein Csb2